ncbi:MAG: PDZ domain-containing protein [Deltaproteobacteria bacterium]|nr:PDZ domain-containing protein [Deltaproteobacteria bacterium]
MSKYYYLATAIIVGLLIIAFAILSRIDKTILNPSDTPSDNTLSKQPYPILSSKAQDDSSLSLTSPDIKTSKVKKNTSPVSLNLMLVGTTVFGEKSSAIIKDLTKGTRGVYRLGDSIKGFKITKILQYSATLTKNDQVLVLQLNKGGALQSEEFVKKMSENSWMLSADKVTDMVSNIDQYAGQLIAFQHRENGKPSGFRIRHLKQGNDFEKMGIQNGDIIKKVNDLEVNDLSDVLKTVYKLSDDTSFNVQVERDNQTTILNYQLDKSVNPLVPIISNLLNPTGSK